MELIRLLENSIHHFKNIEVNQTVIFVYLYSLVHECVAYNRICDAQIELQFFFLRYGKSSISNNKYKSEVVMLKQFLLVFYFWSVWYWHRT